MADVGVIVARLDELITVSVRDMCSDQTGIIFSSGVDSTLVARYAARESEITAYVVGFEGSPDLECAIRNEKELGFPLEKIIIKLDELEAILPEIVGIVGEPNPVKVGVGVPMYYASKKASEDGYKVMLCGQGADELFSGYWRYVEAYVSEGPEKVVELMKSDVSTADKDNLDRDRACCKHNNVELRMPFLSAKLVEYIQGLQLDLKIKEVDASFNEFSCIDDVEGRKFVRKYVLRKLAEKNGVTTEIINRSKKAAQYGSAVNKHLEKIAKKNGYKRIKEYLETLLE